MKFIVSRTSGWEDDPHVDGVRMEILTMRERKAGNTPANLGRHGWYLFDKLKEFRRGEDEYITSDVERVRYMLKIETLEELLALVEKEGDVIVGKDHQDSSFYCLKIYDDYRE